MAELPFVAEAPGVDLTGASDSSRKVIATTDIHHLLIREVLQPLRQVDRLNRWNAELTEVVVAPAVYPSLLVESESEVYSAGYLGYVLQWNQLWLGFKTLPTDALFIAPAVDCAGLRQSHCVLS